MRNHNDNNNNNNKKIMTISIPCKAPPEGLYRNEVHTQLYHHAGSHPPYSQLPCRGCVGLDDGKIYNFKIRKKILFLNFFEKIIICFVNVEIDPRLR
jgi:hypothetical protein